MRLGAVRWTIRPATDADAEAIAAITVAGWRVAYRGIVPDARLDALDPEAIAAARRATIAEPDPRAVLVAEDALGVRGYTIVGGPHAPERDGHPTVPTGEPSGELSTLYVDPAVIGTGAGAALHDAGLAHLRAAGFRRATLWVYAANTPAIGFYEHRGWRRDGDPCHPAEWSAPAVRMACVL